MHLFYAVHLDFPGKQGSGGEVFCWDVRTSRTSLCLDPIRSFYYIDTCFGKGLETEKPFKPFILSVEDQRIQENYNEERAKEVPYLQWFFLC